MRTKTLIYEDWISYMRIGVGPHISRHDMHWPFLCRCLHIIQVGAPVTSVACSSEDVPFGTSRYCAAGTEDGTINIYSMESWKLVLSWKAHKGAITSMWSDGQNELVTGGHDGWIKVCATLTLIHISIHSSIITLNLILASHILIHDWVSGAWDLFDGLRSRV
jgi:WD40 repeat protein